MNPVKLALIDDAGEGLTVPHTHRALPILALALCLAMSGCGSKQQQSNGYKPGVTPGISRAQVEQIVGKPQESGPFSLPGVKADVMTYPWGQVLLQSERVVAVSVNSDPAFRGPAGVSIGMSEDQVKAAFAAHPAHRSGRRESYDAIEKTNDTKTRDIYDLTDRVMIELAAANPNDPNAPYSVSQVTFADPAGFKLLESFTKARVDGLYPDVHVNNFIADPWPSAR
ncbi:MAG: hypothetical protein M3Z37_11455 [Candidatus Eremiobacteraeota bacterium]|nr:hypothetical protein [Candidatus Eremiobacteraeota bacterium]